MPHASGKPCLGSLHAAARQPNAPHRAEGPPAAAARSSRAARHAARDSRSPARPASPERANSQRGKNSLATGLPPSLSLSSPPSPSLDLCLARCVIATGNTRRAPTSVSACSRRRAVGSLSLPGPDSLLCAHRRRSRKPWDAASHSASAPPLLRSPRRVHSPGSTACSRYRTSPNTAPAS